MKCENFLTLMVLCVCSVNAFSGVELQDKESMKKAAGIHGEFYFRQGNDFSVWQTNARNSLMEKLGIAKKLSASRIPLSPRILWQRKVENGTVIKMEIQAEKDYSLPFYLCLPDGNGPFPVWICV